MARSPAVSHTPAAVDRCEPLVVRRHRSAAAGQRVSKILIRDPVDVVHVEGFYLMQRVPHWSPAPVLLVEQNVEHDLERQRVAAVALPDRLGVLLHCLRSRRAEIETWWRAQPLAAVTPEDRALIRAAAPGTDVRLVPDGADHVPARARARRPPGAPPCALHAAAPFAAA